MPYKRKKTYRKKKRRSVRRIPRGIPFLNIPKVSKLKYTESVKLISVSGSLGSNIFRLQSIYDPNLSGVGHQPYGHDTMMTMFNHYTVMGAKVSISFTPVDTGTPSAVGVLVSPTNSIPYTTYDAIKEARQGVQKQLRGGASGTLGMSINYSTKKFFNVSNIKDNVSRLGASFGSDPVENSYLFVYQQPLDFTSSVNVYATVSIDYVVMFSEPKLLPTS